MRDELRLGDRDAKYRAEGHGDAGVLIPATWMMGRGDSVGWEGRDGRAILGSRRLSLSSSSLSSGAVMYMAFSNEKRDDDKSAFGKCLPSLFFVNFIKILTTHE